VNYLGAFVFKVKDGTSVGNEAAHIAVGVDAGCDGNLHRLRLDLRGCSGRRSGFHRPARGCTSPPLVATSRSSG
jgi:hypothetical protein